ncbi:AAA family ATPase [Pyrococcus kukulkanii]|uniref:ATP-binding protein n=1 Tax=Pyrococcus kukulkanii TaxID=1609559 RepID=A0ABV4T7N9_9EURY
MYFDDRPKERREDLYDREREIKDILSLIDENRPLIVITGIRRLGKTSLLRVALNEAGREYVIVDLRGINPRSKRDLILRFQYGINESLRKFSRIKDYLKFVEGVEIAGLRVKLSWKSPETLYEVLSSLQERGVVIAIDEVQDARGPVGKELASAIAHFYDYGSSTVILTGSQVGLLYDFLGVENPRAPLYGRVWHEVKLERFSREESIEFLKLGFSQVNLTPPGWFLEEAVETLDGIVGWLVKLGVIAMREGFTRQVITRMLEESSKLVLEELNSFLAKRGRAREKYMELLRAIAQGKDTWDELKETLGVGDSSLAKLLDNLAKASFIEKVGGRYRIQDPVLKFSLLSRWP